jgi:uncharacterized membrane protein
MNKSRLEAFSDAIFGFAATLLILGIALPEFKNTVPSDAELARALAPRCAYSHPTWRSSIMGI